VPENQAAEAANCATLACGTVLTYELKTSVPGVNELVPCRRHGFCPVTARRTGGRRPDAERRRRRRPRSTDELVGHLSDHLVTHLDALRRQGFTLRLLIQAQAAGLVEVDVLSGRVALNSGPPRSTDGVSVTHPRDSCDLA
jgi:hypothetical protein